MMRSFNPDFVFPVVEYSHPVQRSFRLGLHGAINFLHPEYEMSRTQDLERTYHDAGQFYWGKKDSWLMGKRMHGDGLGMVIPAWRVVDIDTEQDWKMAELIFQTIKLGI
jgi:CMP-N-acetylneuraminic acid synthetase